MRYSVYIILLYGVFIHFVQAERIDSLWKFLKQSNAKNYEPILNEIEKVIENESIDKKYEHAIQTIDIAKRLSFPNAHSVSYLILARLYLKYDSADKSVIIAKKGYEIAKSNNLLLETAMTSECIAYIYSSVDNYTAAMRYVLEAQNIYKQLGMPSKSFSTMYTVASTSYTLGNYDEVIRYIGNLTEKDFEHQEPRAIINAINLLGLAYRKKKQYEKAIHYFNKGIEKAKQFKDTIWIGILEGNIGDVYYEQNLCETAKPYLLKDVELSLKYKEYSNAAISIMRIGECEFKQNKPKKALKLFDSALVIMQKDDKYARALDYEKYLLFKNLSEVCEKLNYIDKALYYMKEAYRFRDSLQKKRKEIEIKKMQVNFDFNQKVNIINERNKEKEKAHKKVALLASIIAGLLGMIVVVLFLFLHKQRKLNQQIQEQNKIIEGYNSLLEKQVLERTAQLQEKNEELLKINERLEGFAYVIAHNLRAPVASMLGLKTIFNHNQFDSPDNHYIVEKMFESVEKLDETIKDLNLILKIRSTIDEIKEEISLADEVEKALFALRDEIEKSKVIIKNEIKPDIVILGIKPYVGSIFFNLISNSIKYRDTQKEQSFVIIRSIKKEKSIQIEIEDNGLGMDLSKGSDKIFALYKRLNHDNNIEGKGIGLYLVRTQVEVMRGSISVQSEPYKGTIFNIELPIK